MSNTKLTLSEESKSKPPDEVFDLLEKIGHGSYATVYRGVKRVTGEICAIKKIESHRSNIASFNEIHIMRHCLETLETCENIVQYFCSYVVNDKEIWIVMEYGGLSISEIMKRVKRTLYEKEIACILKDTLAALNYLHTHSIIHRDIKAANILLNDDGQAKLADFGIAVKVDKEAKIRTQLGTLLWFAPEMALGEEYNHLVDIWSLGITAIEISQGEPPHTNKKDEDNIIDAITNSPAPTLNNPNNWSKSFIDFVSNCLVKDPEMRYDSSQLLNHHFIITAPESCILKDIIEDAKGRKQSNPSTSRANIALYSNVSLVEEPKYQNYRDLSEPSLDEQMREIDARYAKAREAIINRLKIKIKPILEVKKKKWPER